MAQGKSKKHGKKKKTKTPQPVFKPPGKGFIRNALILALALTAVSYSNIFNNELTNWDDDRYVNKNPYIRQITADNLQAVFFGDAKFYMGNYHPLTLLSLAVDFQLSDTQKVDKDIEYKVNPAIFHLTNLLLHMATMALVFFMTLHLLNFLKYRKSGEVALIAAVLFGVHTMHVESVTWISERKDVLHAAFFFGAILAYQHYLQKKRMSWLAGSMLLFLLSLLSKGQAVSLALILPALDWIYNRNLKSPRLWLEKLPFFALSLVFGLIAVNAQEATEAIHKDEEFSLFERMIYASYGFTMYLGKLVWPFELSAIYPYPYSSGNIPASYSLFFAIPAGYIYLLLRFIKKNPLAAFGLYFFAANIVFLLQLLPVGNAVMADRYVYIPSAGFFLIIAMLYRRISIKKPALTKMAQIALAFYIIALGVKTFQRNEVWASSMALWNDVISKKSNATVAYNNRGSLHRGQESYRKAVDDYSMAIKLDNTYAHAYYNRGTTLKDWGKEINNPDLYKKAIPDFNKALKHKPQFPEAYHNRGLCYDNLGIYDKALKDFNKAIELNIEDYKIYVNRGVVKGKTGKLQEALEDFKKALSMAPQQPDALSNMGLAYSHLQEYQKALTYYSRAIEADPSFSNAYYNRGLLHANQNRIGKAMADFTQTIRMDKKNAAAYYQRALLYRQNQKSNKACKDLQRAANLGHIAAKRLFAKTCKN